MTEGFVRKVNFPAIPFHSLEIIPSPKSFIKNKLLIVSGKSNEENMNMLALHDIIKCADIICPVLSCRSADTTSMALDPEKAKAIDETGYSYINIIRSMGTPTTVGIVQHL